MAIDKRLIHEVLLAVVLSVMSSALVAEAVYSYRIGNGNIWLEMAEQEFKK